MRCWERRHDDGDDSILIADTHHAGFHAIVPANSLCNWWFGTVFQYPNPKPACIYIHKILPYEHTANLAASCFCVCIASGCSMPTRFRTLQKKWKRTTLYNYALSTSNLASNLALPNFYPTCLLFSFPLFLHSSLPLLPPFSSLPPSLFPPSLTSPPSFLLSSLSHLPYFPPSPSSFIFPTPWLHFPGIIECLQALLWFIGFLVDLGKQQEILGVLHHCI